MMRLVAAPDKFRGSARAAEVAAAIGEVAWEAGWDVIEMPFSDGGEGLLDVFGGPNRVSEVHGPLGERVRAPWRLSKGTAVIEMAAASGLDLIGGSTCNDPLRADTTGTGELLLAAVHAGAERIIVGLGGSASTDGGLGAVETIADPARLAGTQVIAACDVDIPFVDAASRFAPQKGASANQVRLLERRLEALAGRYVEDFGIDESVLAHAGAAGGLAGGLAALGAELVPGFDVVAEELALDTRLEGVDLVVTGEGFVDAGSFDGKVVGGICGVGESAGIPVLVIAGDVDEAVSDRIRCVSLVERHGEEKALAAPLECIREVVRAHLATW